MKKEIMAILQNDDVDLGSIYNSLLPHQKEHCLSVAGLTSQLVEWVMAEEEIEEDFGNPELIYRAALYHDIGLAFIPERVLYKTDDLTGSETRVIQRHPTYGATIIDRYRKQNCKPDSEEDALWAMAAEIALSHHERWDGKGYPYGQSTTGISACARATAIADAYDSIIKGAPFRMALPPEYALLEIVHNSGKQFDPQLSEVFRKHMIQNFI